MLSIEGAVPANLAGCHRHMSTEKTKGGQEIEMFSKFVKASKLPFDLDTLQKLVPPAPDILCEHRQYGPMAFELVEICDSRLASAKSRLANGGVEYSRTTDPTWDIVRKKLKCKYKCQHPIELLCYTYGRVVTPHQMISQKLRQCVSLMRKSCFRKVWLRTAKGVSLIWERE